MTRHIVTLNVGEEEAKADFIRHVAEVKAHVSPDKVSQITKLRELIIHWRMRVLGIVKQEQHVTTVGFLKCLR